MCSRYDNLIPRDAMQQLFGVEQLPATNFPPRYNIAPTQEVTIVRIDRGGERQLLIARWGLVSPWMKSIPKQPHINARAEAVERTPLFRDAFSARRCLIPATGFYEWERREDGRQPFRFHMRSADPFAFAGLWEGAQIDSQRMRSTTIIVTEANSLVGAIHDRMPVILPAEAYAEWLDPNTTINAAKEMLRPFPEALMEAYPVSRAVNHYEKDDEECIRPIVLYNGPEQPTESDQPSLPGLLGECSVSARRWGKRGSTGQRLITGGSTMSSSETSSIGSALCTWMMCLAPGSRRESSSRNAPPAADPEGRDRRQ